jgi:predicted transposase/invertase (TIGR01784 family)
MDIDIDRRRHDTILKKVFEYPKMVREFFRQHLPEEMQQILDINTLKAVPENFVDDNLSNSACDILFHAKCHNSQDGYVYLMLEGQSSSDRLMAFRLLHYMTQIIANHIKQYGEKEKLPMVYPMVLWQKDGIYSAKRNVWDLFNYPDLARKIWTGDHRLIDLQTIPDKVLTQEPWSGLFQLVTKYIGKPNLLHKIDEFSELLKKLSTQSQGGNFLKHILRYVLTAIEKSGKIKLSEIVMKNTNDGSKIMGSLAQEFINEGIGIGKAEGIGIGKAEGIGIGKAEGIGIGKAEGIGIGKAERDMEIAEKLLLKHVQLDEIADITSLSLEQIQVIANKLSYRR